jgi:hypothetical protein
MASQDFFQIRSLAGEEKLIQVIDDTPVVLRIKDVAGGSSTPTVVLSDTSSDITLTDSNGDVITADLSNASYSTVGEVADWINGYSASWQCKILDALRSDATDNKWPNGAVSASTVEGEQVFDVKSDTSALAAYRLRITYDRSAGSLKPKGSHRVILKEFTGNLDHTAAAGVAKIYEIDGTTETQVWASPLTVDTTATTYDFDDGVTPGEGKDFVIAWDGTVIDAGANVLTAQYKRE